MAVKPDYQAELVDIPITIPHHVEIVRPSSRCVQHGRGRKHGGAQGGGRAGQVQVARQPPSAPALVACEMHWPLRRSCRCFTAGLVGWVLRHAADVSRYKYIVWLDSSMRGPFLPTYVQDMQVRMGHAQQRLGDGQLFLLQSASLQLWAAGGCGTMAVLNGAKGPCRQRGAAAALAPA